MSIGDKNVQVDDLIHHNDQFHVNDDFVVNDDDDDEQSHFFDVSDEFDHIEIFEHHDTDGECVYVPKSFCVGSEEISSSGIKSWTPNVDKSLLSAIGMVFDSIDLAYNFYKEYAVNGGFEVRKSSSKRGFGDFGNSLVRYKYFLCSKQGSNQEILHKPEDVSATDDIFDMNADCFGEVNTLTSVDDNVGYIVKQTLHIQVENKKRRRKEIGHHRGHDVLLLLLNQAGIGPCRGYRILEKVKGSDEDVECSKWELAGAFWANQASKENYKVFGDVVSFDSTFRINKYDMKFIPFTGIDNHKECITFGAALLAKEDADSYTWLCEAFKKAFPEEPQIVLTDQDPSMIVAIEDVFKKARHRLYSVSQIVWTNKLDPDEFDNRWFSIVARYKLEDNEWLNEMFNLRRKWIPTYFRYWDMSGLMRTSSRSESENHMFQQLMSNSSTLSKNDHKSRYTIPKVVTNYEIEQHAVQLYTRIFFGEVQGQIKAASRYCMNYQVDHKNGFTEYTVMDGSVINNGLPNNLDKAGNPRAFDEYIPAVSVVKYSEKSKEVSCDCRLFERIGYFYRHILYVLRMTNVKVIPNKYVMKRWCIDAITLKDPNTYFDSNQVGSSEEFGVQMKEIYEMVDHAIGLYKDDHEKLSSLKDTIRGLKDKAVEEMGNDNTLSKDEFIEGLINGQKLGQIHQKFGQRWSIIENSNLNSKN
ncbi:protein FAR1-RELATED SEQUENCE 5-like [Rutidosis leptorrhynchoides]|uniref:protein FAR1-RELATED SEQUENCE 5-like n=1 Tax=Rutidosis leptorrhynchoides TaxID=125765 RepID=UPI003A9A1103